MVFLSSHNSKAPEIGGVAIFKEYFYTECLSYLIFSFQIYQFELIVKRKGPFNRSHFFL